MPRPVDTTRRGAHTGRVRRSVLASIVVLLASSAVLEGVAYAQRADDCWFMRLPRAERPPCCDLMGKTRVTLPGGDCCKLLVWDAGQDRVVSDGAVDVPLAALVVLPRFVLSGHPPAVTVATPRQARAPPPPWRPTDTVRLLI